MDVVIAVHAAGAVMLLVAGAAKVSRPLPTADLLAVLGLPARLGPVRALGVVEISLAVTALAVGGPAAAAAVGALFVAFAVVVVRSLALGAASCGCFGRSDTPPSWIHAAGNVVVAIASFATAAADRTPVDAMRDQPARGAPFVLMVGVLAGLAMAAFTALPEALAARRPGSSGPRPFRVSGPARHRSGGPT